MGGPVVSIKLQRYWKIKCDFCGEPCILDGKIHKTKKEVLNFLQEDWIIENNKIFCNKECKKDSNDFEIKKMEMECNERTDKNV
jgi:hypothetical protein